MWDNSCSGGFRVAPVPGDTEQHWGWSWPPPPPQHPVMYPSLVPQCPQLVQNTSQTPQQGWLPLLRAQRHQPYSEAFWRGGNCGADAETWHGVPENMFHELLAPSPSLTAALPRMELPPLSPGIQASVMDDAEVLETVRRGWSGGTGEGGKPMSTSHVQSAPNCAPKSAKETWHSSLGQHEPRSVGRSVSMQGTHRGGNPHLAPGG